MLLRLVISQGSTMATRQLPTLFNNPIWISFEKAIETENGYLTKNKTDKENK